MSKFNQVVLVSFLVVGLTIFNLSSFLVLAEEGEGEVTETTEEVSEDTGGQEGDTSGDPPPEEPVVETQTEETPEQPEETIIATGDAEVDADVDNQVNTNIANVGDIEEEPPVEDPVETPAEEEEEVISGDEEGSEEVTEEGGEEELLEGSGEESVEAEDQDPCPPGETCLDVENDNEAEVGNDIDGEANTGENEASDNGGDVIIATGDADAQANVENTVNTNITGSDFWFILSNFFYGLLGNIIFGDFGSNDVNCGLIDCVDDVEVSNTNEGEIINDVELYALTGNNTADNNGGDALIGTGNARVVANIANTLNTNITGSDWLFTILNNFGDWYGNLVLPGKQTIENIVNGGDSSAGGDINVENNNEGGVENNINVGAETGENEANDNDGGSTIITGDAEAETNIFNLVNTNIFGDNWLLVAVKVFGDWTGDVFSVPDGVSWIRTPDGIILFNTNIFEDLFTSFMPEGCDDDGVGCTSLDVINNNIGTVVNNVNLLAATGENSASGNTGSGTIVTGDASATANVVNFVNNNIIGRNWLFALINVFGNWQGNLSFGQPNLWLGESANTPNNLPGPGDVITYNLTYTNNGNADATGVILSDIFDEDFLSIVDFGGGISDIPGHIEWDLGTVGIGESRSISYSVRINPYIPFGYSYIVNESEIEALEDDANNEDNFDSLSIKVYHQSSDPINPVVSYPEFPRLILNKTINANDVVYTPSIVEYTITLTNDSSSPAYDVVINDILEDEFGEVITANSWDLDYVFAHETITIDYAVGIGTEVLPGFYTNTAQANGFYVWGDPVSSNEYSITFEVRQGEVMEEEVAEELIEEELIEEPVGGEEDVEEQEFIVELPDLGDLGIGIGICAEEDCDEAPAEEEAVEEETEELVGIGEEKLSNGFFASVGEFFFGFGLMDFLILLIIIAVLVLILLIIERKKLERS